MIRSATKIPLIRVGLLICSVALSACENPWLDKAPSLDEVLSRGWLFGDLKAEDAPKSAAPVYCYETIGVGDCYVEPLSDGGNRLIGYEGPKPLALQR